jgi:hypothetical protein
LPARPPALPRHAAPACRPAGSELAPSDERLLTQQGGCIGFDGRQTVFRHADAGILKYADVDALLAAMLPGGPATPPQTQVLRTLL